MYPGSVSICNAIEFGGASNMIPQVYRSSNSDTQPCDGGVSSTTAIDEVYEETNKMTPNHMNIDKTREEIRLGVMSSAPWVNEA